MNELSLFFVTVANPAGAGVVPIDDKVKEDVFSQTLGTISQAGSTKVLSIANAAVWYKVSSFLPEPEQFTDLAHPTKTARVAGVGWVTEATDGSVNAKVNW